MGPIIALPSPPPEAASAHRRFSIVQPGPGSDRVLSRMLTASFSDQLEPTLPLGGGKLHELLEAFADTGPSLGRELLEFPQVVQQALAPGRVERPKSLVLLAQRRLFTFGHRLPLPEILAKLLLLGFRELI